jgi:hypothetical protein
MTENPEFVSPRFKNHAFYNRGYAFNATAAVYNLSQKEYPGITPFCITSVIPEPGPDLIHCSLVERLRDGLGRKFELAGVVDNNGNYFSPERFELQASGFIQPLDKCDGAYLPIPLDGQIHHTSKQSLHMMPYPVEGFLLSSGAHYILKDSGSDNYHKFASMLAYALLSDKVWQLVVEHICPLRDFISTLLHGAPRNSIWEVTSREDVRAMVNDIQVELTKG